MYAASGPSTNRRTFVRGAALAVAGFSLRTFAQNAGALPRLGLLTVGRTPVEEAFLAGLREQGYVDGRTIILESRSAEGDFDRLPGLAAELVRLKPQVIAAIVTQPSVAAREATATIPIVMVSVSDPVAAGMVGNLARPGGNVTGTAAHVHDAIGKQVELMRQVLPRLTRIAVLWNPANVVFQQQSLGEALISASRARVVAIPVSVRSHEDLERTFAALESDRLDAVLLLQDRLMIAHGARVAELAIAHRMPAFSGEKVLTQAGILASYGPDLTIMARRAAVYVRKILNGAKPGDLPVELPSRLELVINARTAATLGITIPASVLVRADEVIR